MNSEKDISSIGNIVNRIFTNMDSGVTENALRIYSAWEKILLRIKPPAGSVTGNPNTGRNMADHSRVVDLKNGMLLVETDHPGWTELIQFHKNYILRGFQMEFPELKIHSMAFRLAGSNASLGRNVRQDEKDARQNSMRMIEMQEKLDKSAGIQPENTDKNTEPKKIPDELRGIFEDLGKNMGIY